MSIKYTVENSIHAEHGVVIDGSNMGSLKGVEQHVAVDIEETVEVGDVLQGFEHPAHVGFDVEYEFNPETNENDIVFYHFHLIGLSKTLKGGIRSGCFNREYSKSFIKFFANVLQTFCK